MSGDDDFKELIDPDVIKLWYLSRLKNLKEDELYYSVADIIKNLDHIPKVKVFMMTVDEREETSFIEHFVESEDENVDFD